MRGVLLLFAGLSLALAGCVSTNEIQLSQNVWRIDASGSGALVRGRTANALFRRAAELTVEQGYSHFVVGVPETGSSRSIGGFTPIQANVVGNSVFFYGGQPINVYRESTTAAVIMSNSPANGALNAQDALARLSSQ